jgi:hypothetical protein
MGSGAGMEDQRQRPCGCGGSGAVGVEGGAPVASQA